MTLNNCIQVKKSGKCWLENSLNVLNPNKYTIKLCKELKHFLFVPDAVVRAAATPYEREDDDVVLLALIVVHDGDGHVGQMGIIS